MDFHLSLDVAFRWISASFPHAESSPGPREWVTMPFGQQAWMAKKEQNMARETFVAWWHGLNVGQQQALVQKFYHAAGGDKSNAQENFEGVLKGELTAEIAFKDATVVLVDRNGRCIPTDTVTGQVVNANRAYHLDQPEIN